MMMSSVQLNTFRAMPPAYSAKTGAPSSTDSTSKPLASGLSSASYSGSASADTEQVNSGFCGIGLFCGAMASCCAMIGLVGFGLVSASKGILGKLGNGAG
jgi:hypothetical protein